MNGAMLQQYPGLPKVRFPMLPTNVLWKLYQDVTINSKGFASTIDSITGRTEHKAIVDLGG
eukprot:10138623-Karenia_brevis.AAC.1